MTSNYDIFKEHSDGSFVWIETVEDVAAAKQRLEILAVEHPGNYHLWDSIAQKFVNPLVKSAST
jgi:hypothetical protein